MYREFCVAKWRKDCFGAAPAIDSKCSARVHNGRDYIFANVEAMKEIGIDISHHDKVQ